MAKNDAIMKPEDKDKCEKPKVDKAKLEAQKALKQAAIVNNQIVTKDEKCLDYGKQ